MSSCPHRNDGPGRCAVLCGRSVSGDRFACGGGYCEQCYHSPFEESERPLLDTSAFFVAGRSAVGWRGDWAALFYPEQNAIEAVPFCRYAPDEAPPGWIGLDLRSQAQDA